MCEPPPSFPFSSAAEVLAAREQVAWFRPVSVQVGAEQVSVVDGAIRYQAQVVGERPAQS